MISVDKVLHFAVCFMIAAVEAMIMRASDVSVAWCSLAGFAAAMLIGVGKEVYDYYVRKTGFDKNDLLADASGALLAALFCLGL